MRKKKNIKLKAGKGEKVTPPKNISARYPNGRTLKTSDKYLPESERGKQKRKPTDEAKATRWVAVVDSNRNDELAVVRLTTQNQLNTTSLPGYKKGAGKATYFKHIVEIVDRDGKAIKVDGEKFLENPWAYDLSKEDVNLIQQTIRGRSKHASENKRKLQDLKKPKK